MKAALAVLLCALSVSACSETPLEERDEAEFIEIEKQIEADALSLEQAADEAVKILEADLASDLPDPDLNIETSEPQVEQEVD